VNMRLLGLLFLVVSAAGVLFLLGLYAGHKGTFPVGQIRTVYEKIKPPQVETEVRRTTSVLPLRLEFESVVPSAPSAAFHGGGIDVAGDELVGITRRGEFFYFRAGSGEPPKKLDMTLNINHQQFKRYLRERAMQVARADQRFGMIDLLYLQSESRLLVSHNHWHPGAQCYTLRVSELPVASQMDLGGLTAAAHDWRVLWESTPCLRTSLAIRQFAPHQAGGRMVAPDEESILLSVGDHGFDGVSSKLRVSQDEESDYGQIVRIRLADGHSDTVSTGHRNPQGLTIDSTGVVWSTEHGPRGGDELNIIEPGGNYGWPLVTYGTHYGSTSWPISHSQGRHQRFAAPVFAWVPSVATSSVMEVQDFAAEWDGDLLVGSLEQQALFRLRHRDGAVLLAEPIKTGVRVRDLDQFADGTIVLFADDGRLVKVSVDRTEREDTAWLSEDLSETARQAAMAAVADCQECHSVLPGELDGGAPNLFGVFGRQIAASEFAGYSDALKGTRGSWNYAALDKFLRDGQAFAPGNRMQSGNVTDDAVRDAVIRYLRRLD